MKTKTFIQDCLHEIKDIEHNFLDYLENQVSQEVDFQDLINYLFDQKLREDKYKLKSMLHLISRISAGHHRSIFFFSKIEQILNIFKKEIKQNFSNFEIFTIFKFNKRILYFLFHNDILAPDNCIASLLTTEKYFNRYYPHYFFYEFKPFLQDSVVNEIKTDISPDIFKQKMIDGENDAEICKLIRNDLINDFISHVNETKTSLKSKIKPSIFETNAFLIQKEPSLIEYSAFFGSSQIFKYLHSNGVELTSSLWLYAIHGKNLDIIHLLEGSRIKPEDSSFIECFIESIICHHGDMTNYIFNNLIENTNKEDFNLFTLSLKHYNFIFFSDILYCGLNILDSSNSKEFDIFYDFVQYDYYPIVEYFLNEKMVDVNSKRTKDLVPNQLIF
ncbi:hypothetical protein M9Y10_030848 [Tritrichomonas musculus]|uniref:DUF3447 domain-containing protein n=1 Tax=Tritrichomonas musculus TaxID=1915356 RepID=A0ABR2H263_9EUKA